MTLQDLSTFWGLLPLALSVGLVFLAKKAAPGGGLSALCGVAMIALSAWAIELLWSVKTFFVAIQGKPSIVESDRLHAISSIDLWVLVVPVAIACIGVNLISTWILQPRSS